VHGQAVDRDPVEHDGGKGAEREGEEERGRPRVVGRAQVEEERYESGGEAEHDAEEERPWGYRVQPPEPAPEGRERQEVRVAEAQGRGERVHGAANVLRGRVRVGDGNERKRRVAQEEGRDQRDRDERDAHDRRRSPRAAPRASERVRETAPTAGKRDLGEGGEDDEA